jgi:hypothetical protein
LDDRAPKIEVDQVEPDDFTPSQSQVMQQPEHSQVTNASRSDGPFLGDRQHGLPAIATRA